MFLCLGNNSPCHIVPRDYETEVMVAVSNPLPNFKVQHLSFWAEVVEPAAASMESSLAAGVTVADLEEASAIARYQAREAFASEHRCCIRPCCETPVRKSVPKSRQTRLHGTPTFSKERRMRLESMC